MHRLTEVEAVARATTLHVEAEARPFLLGIVGPPGVGKSTLAEHLAATIAAPLLPMDGFHFANAHLDRLGLRQRKGAPETFDVGGFVSALARLRAGQDIVAPLFDRTFDAAIAGALAVTGGARLVLVEGNYLLHDADGWEAVGPLLDEVWYLDVDEDLRIERLVQRHQRFGRSREDAVRWASVVDGPNATLIATTRDRAHAVVTLS